MLSHPVSRLPSDEGAWLTSSTPLATDLHSCIILFVVTRNQAVYAFNFLIMHLLPELVYAYTSHSLWITWKENTLPLHLSSCLDSITSVFELMCTCTSVAHPLCVMGKLALFTFSFRITLTSRLSQSWHTHPWVYHCSYNVGRLANTLPLTQNSTILFECKIHNYKPEYTVHVTDVISDPGKIWILVCKTSWPNLEHCCRNYFQSSGLTIKTGCTQFKDICYLRPYCLGFYIHEFLRSRLGCGICMCSMSILNCKSSHNIQTWI